MVASASLEAGTISPVSVVFGLGLTPTDAVGMIPTEETPGLGLPGLYATISFW